MSLAAPGLDDGRARGHGLKAGSNTVLNAGGSDPARFLWDHAGCARAGGAGSPVEHRRRRAEANTPSAPGGPRAGLLRALRGATL